MSAPYGTSFALLRDAAGPDWGAYTQHAFVAQLAEGTLPRAAFLHYLRQDYVFLTHFARAWALAVVKSDTTPEMQAAVQIVYALITEEMPLHIRLCADQGISEAELAATPERPENLAYTRYVLEAGHRGDLLDLLAALAPCVIGYAEIGQRLAEAPHSATYSDWIATYGGDAYQQVARDVGALLDGALVQRLGAGYAALPRWQGLCARFATATRLEAGFWQMGLTP